MSEFFEFGALWSERSFSRAGIWKIERTWNLDQTRILTALMLISYSGECKKSRITWGICLKWKAGNARNKSVGNSMSEFFEFWTLSDAFHFSNAGPRKTALASKCQRLEEVAHGIAYRFFVCSSGLSKLSSHLDQTQFLTTRIFLLILLRRATRCFGT